MRAVVVLALLATVSALRISEEVYQSEFTEFVAEFDKSYSVPEFFKRFQIFKENYAGIVAHNNGNHTWTQGVNQFSDLTADEFEALYLRGVLGGYEAPLSQQQPFELAGEKDWRKDGAVSPVKNQAQCGSCWAFATTGTLEGWDFLKTRQPIKSLSEQQLVDCSGSTGNQGCNGGWPKWALTYLERNGGSCDQASYPYTGRDGTCKKTCTPVVKPTAHKELTNEAQLAPAIEIAPVSIALTASSAFQSYKSGVFTGTCPGQVNHAVLLTGYGTQGTTDYWWVKNSWGASWGETGYIRLPRNQNKCQLGYASAYPTA